MKLTKLIPVLYTLELEATIEFYNRNFGFICQAIDSDLEWATLSLNNIEIMLSKPNVHLAFNEAVFTGSFYFLTDDVDELWNKVKHKIKVCYPITDFEYGMREFAVYDNNGFLLQFGKEIISIPTQN